MIVVVMVQKGMGVVIFAVVASLQTKNYGTKVSAFGLVEVEKNAERRVVFDVGQQTTGTFVTKLKLVFA